MVTKAGEIELDVRLTGDDISKTLHKISDSITKKFDSAFSSLSKDFENVSTDMKQSFSKVAEGVSQKTEKEFSNIKGSGEQLSNSVSSSFKKIGMAVVAAFSVAKIKEFGQQCIESAAEVNAANSQFEQTFGTMQSQAESAIQSVANQSGILETRLQGVGTSIYAFAKTTGMDSSSALGMMQEALQVTADSAAYYDRSLEDTAESLKSFLKGNFENDAALGLSCTETTRNAAANKLYGKSFTDLSESQKQLTLLQMVKDANQLSGAMGQASREADGWENVTGNLRESWKQLLAVVGQPILQVATQVVKRLSSALATLTEYAKGAVESLSKVFGWDTGNNTASNIKSASDSAKSLTDTADDSSKSLDNVQKSSEKAKRSVAGFDKLNMLSSSDSSSSKSDTSSSKSSSGGSSGGAVAKNVVKDTSKNLSGAFKNLYEKSGFKGFVENVQKGINKVDWSAIGKNCKTVFDNAVPIVQKAFGTMQKVGSAKLGAIGSAFGAVATIGGIAGIIGAAFGQDWSFSMPENPPLIPRFEEPTESPARKFAKGGIVKAPTLAVVGDNAGANSGNPEAISPLNKLQGMLDNSGGQDTVILTQILDLLKRIYEMFIIFRNNGGNTYSFTAELEGSTLFEEMIRQDELYRRRHNGKSAFA